MTVGFYGGYGPAIAGADYPAGPIAWNAGQSYPLRIPEYLFAQDLNQQLSSAVSFLASKPSFKAVQNGGTTFSPSTVTPLTLDTEITDPWNMHSNSGDTSQVVVPTGCDGVWLLHGQVSFYGGTGGSAYQALVAHNGTAAPGDTFQMWPGGGVPQPGALDLVAASAGDYFQLCGYTTYSAAGTYNGLQVPMFGCRWIAANNSVPAGVMQVPFVQGDGTWSVNESFQLSVPAPSTWTSLEEISSSQLNSDILNSVLFLSNVPFMRATLTGSAPTIAASTATQITGLTENLDNWGAFNSSTNTWTAPVAGHYLIMGLVSFPSEGTAYSAYAELNATLSSITSHYVGSMAYGPQPGSMVVKTLPFSAGDTLTLSGWHNYTSSLSPVTGASTRLITIWVSK